MDGQLRRAHRGRPRQRHHRQEQRIPPTGLWHRGRAGHQLRPPRARRVVAERADSREPQPTQERLRHIGRGGRRRGLRRLHHRGRVDTPFLARGDDEKERGRSRDSRLLSPDSRLPFTRGCRRGA